MSEKELTKAISKLSRTIVKHEELTLKAERSFNLTINELNLIECIRTAMEGNEGPTVSTIAANLDITRPSATVAINKLLAKKYVEKSGCSNDGRSVRVKLTAKGEKVYGIHKNYQDSLKKELVAEFGKDFETALTAICKLAGYIDEKNQELEAEEDDF